MRLCGFVPARTPRTLLAATATLGVAWISPMIDRVGTVYTFRPPRYTDRLLGALSLSCHHAMIPTAPVEVLLLALLVVSPLRALMGREQALGESGVGR